MSDQQITCSDCGDVFVFTAAEQAFYSEKGLASPPKRCKACRQARKTSRGPASQGHGGGGGPRRYSNDVNEYRSPMSGGAGDRGFARGGDRFGNSHGQSHGQEWARGGGGGNPRRGSFGGNRNGGPPPREGNHWNGQGGSSSDYRSPAFPQSRGEGRGGAPRDGRPRRGDGPPRDARPRASSPEARPSPRPPAQPRPERPKYDITCGECGAAAQVPFKPLEGRQVFCQECYRARRGTPRDTATATDVAETDTGIVE